MFVYILESENFPDTFYIGLTQALEQRLQKHNSGDVPYTSKFKPWKIKNHVWFDNASKAIAFEKYLKSGSGRAFCKKHF